ncbi:MAG: TrkH family potassium uptake protein [Clostridiales bacterium]|nr:TrkH family potassium uptake protein [Clostridiales bacterium]
MNKRAILRVVGRILQIEAVLMLPSLLFSLIFCEREWYKFLATMAGAVLLGFALTRVKPRSKNLYARDAFCIVGASWVLLSLVGAVPLFWSGQFPSFWDALFESVSGFTTTGATVLARPELLSRGMQFWRCLTNWLGGMGVLVFVLAFLPLTGGNELQLLRAEAPGPIIGKLRPRMSTTAKLLYLLYTGMSLLLFIFLLCGKMPWFDALCYTLGGFAPHSAGLALYPQTVYFQWVLGVFMLLFGVNFNVYFLLILRRFRDAAKTEELWWYLGILALATAAVFPMIFRLYATAGEGLRHAFFQVSAVMTTNGYVSTNFDLWPPFARQLLLLLMMVGACAGSTAGGLKISRLIILLKSLFGAGKRMLHPRSVQPLRMEGKRVPPETVGSAQTYLTAYALIMLVGILLVSLNGYDMETNISAVAASFNNIGPGLSRVGPEGNYAFFATPVKLLLSFVMLLGRLEIFPLLLLCAPRTWRKK